jgi:hypothetical protein
MQLPTQGVAQYLTPLRVEHLGGRWWRLFEPLRYYSAIVDDIIDTPAGFVTDFASVPRLPIAYWLFGNRANSPAATHDDLYRTGKYSRKTSDLIFREAIEVKGPAWGKGLIQDVKIVSTRVGKETMYTFVRLGGRWSYKKLPGCLDYRACPHKSYI